MRVIQAYIYKLMSESLDCTCVNSRIKKKTLSVIKEIRSEYSLKIERLTNILVERQAKIAELYHSVNEKQAKLNQATAQWEQRQRKLNEVIATMKLEIGNLISERKNREQENNAQLGKLNQRLKSQVTEILQLKKALNFDTLSSVSTISKSSRSNLKATYSFCLEEYFQTYPETTLKVLKSLPEDKPTDEKELGDMVCMFISKDDLSVQKYGSINRTFLKRKLKQEEKRFRFVIIYKPDKE